MKFVTEDFGTEKGILKFPDHYVAIAVTVDDTGVQANDHGKKIVPAGTIVGGASAATLTDPDQAVVNKFVDAAYADKTIGSADNDNAIYGKALEPGTGGNSIKITLADPSDNDKELEIAVTGKEIVVSLATNSEGTITSTAAEVVAALNDDDDVKEFAVFTADIENNDGGSGVCTAVGETAFDGGNNGSATGAEGVLLNDVDVTHGPKDGAMLIHGFVDIAKLPYSDDNEDAAGVAGVLLPMVKFIK